MIDPRRWILAETWLALGLRLEWLTSWEARSLPDGEIQEDDEGHRFIYAGSRVWQVVDGRRSALSRGPYTAPQLGTDSLAHELAHYLAATPEQRVMRNFGIGGMERGAQEAAEEAALEIEVVIDAMVNATARIATMALRGGKDQ